MTQTRELLYLLVQRHSLFTHGSKFDKCGNCQYKCCSSPLSVDISFADLLSMSIVLDESPSEVFNNYCRIGINRDPDLVTACNLKPYEVKLSLELKASCPFHINNQCKIYHKETAKGVIGRPVVCSIFPEIMAIHRTFPVDQQTFSDFEKSISYFSESFPCVKDNQVEFQRGQVLLYLKNLMDQELAVTEALVFGHSTFFIDVEELKDEAGFDTFFGENIKLTHKRLDSVDEVSDRIRLFIQEKHLDLIKRLNSFLNKLEHSPTAFVAILEQLVDKPEILTLPCSDSDLLIHNLYI
ncbi:MAG: hypothetical protein HRT88_09720 [Lentisphaeraceae bacterium]|nr:hypothetical protein [Lentisphaeraceae bacterium]